MGQRHRVISGSHYIYLFIIGNAKVQKVHLLNIFKSNSAGFILSGDVPPLLHVYKHFHKRHPCNVSPHRFVAGVETTLSRSNCYEFPGHEWEHRDQSSLALSNFVGCSLWIVLS